MNAEFTEEEMRQALFGGVASAIPSDVPIIQEPVQNLVLRKKAAPTPKKKGAKTFTPRLRVTLRVGNEFEGKTYDLIHDADTLSTLLAEQEATKAARKKFRYVEVVSVKSL